MNGAATLADCVREGAAVLAAAGVEDPRREARLLLAHALGIEPITVTGYPEREVADSTAFQALVERRAAREPMSHLTGRREFWSLEFSVTRDTLDPRPDSETLVETALGELADRNAPLSVLDLGAGTGCLLLALLSELPAARGIGVDIDPAAVRVARGNAARLGLAGRAEFAAGDWGRALDGRFDLIVANPPYIPTAAIAGLQREVARYEPRRALDGGADGLDCYRALAGDMARLLAPRGAAVLEFGVGQGDDVERIMTASGLPGAGFANDLSGARRCLVCRKQKIDELPPK